MKGSVLHGGAMRARECVDARTQATSGACACRIRLDDVGEGVQ
ncbi:hypothetical protein XBLMG947_0495 [Xanthomonas bromi]|uniref:Uncharacterized protein n=1 Tax=Xanthomonas bromi TaxID=56449 RepID=A0A1C3NH77_9XANT|nr:hypothetical protein XBLMG947_0495 [Xanthomonas bromi]